MEEDLQTRLAKLQELRRELAELQAVVAEAQIAQMNSGQAITLHYIARRFRDIASEMSEWDKNSNSKHS